MWPMVVLRGFDMWVDGSPVNLTWASIGYP